jgi:hypothetical protein
MPHPGCDCREDQEGVRAVCGRVELEVAGQITCGYGETVCEAGAWGECIVNNSVTLHPGGDTSTLGPPGPCQNNPCDPYCKTFSPDNTTGETGQGIVLGNGGITLPGGQSGPAPGTCSGGPKGTCVHHMCETGAKLSPGCDPTPPAGPPQPVPVTLFSDGFANNAAGWSLGAEWQIKSAAASGGHWYGFGDPATDATPTGDNGVAGVVVGGNTTTALHGYRYLTSPIINTGASQNPVTLSFKRWLNSDYPPYMTNRVEVWNGASWVVIWTSAFPGPTDSGWTTQTFDVSAYKNAAFRVRFGHTVGSGGVYLVSSWNIDDVLVTGTQNVAPPPAVPSCVTLVCNNTPSCCSGSWTQACVDKVKTICNADCLSYNGQCYACFKDQYDHDGDGYSFNQGDCADCDVNVNPGALDFPGNGADENCDNVIDNEPVTCDAGLALASSNPWEYARAIDLCRTTTANAPPGPTKTWGVTDAKLVQADGVQGIAALGAGIQAQFGTVNFPLKGARMATFSSGTARYPGQPGFVNPNGQFASYVHGTACSYPSGFPKNKAGCPTSGPQAYDSAGLKVRVRVPTNAKSLAYNFHFFSSEYPEWVCTAYNDTYAALMGSLATNGNISFDSQNNPVTVNVGFFTIPGCAGCNHPILGNTGFNGTCSGQICGGSTNWLVTTAPVTPGELMTMHFSLWDQGDHVWDSSVLVDNWTWSANPATVQTGQQPPPPPPVTYSDGYFIRDYDATGACPQGTSIVWTLWSWTASTPSDSFIDWKIAVADTVAAIGAATEHTLQFSNPPGPAALDTQPAKAKLSPNTQNGSALVDTTLVRLGLPRHKKVLRVKSHLAPSANKLQAPTLLSWNMQFDCIPNE